MNILHLGKYYPPYHGGMEHYLKDLAEAQAQMGHQVTVLTHNHQHGLLTSKSSEQNINQVKVIRQASTRPFLFTPLMLRMHRKIKQLHKKNAIDILHIHWPNPSALRLLIRPLNIPYYLQWHSDMVTEPSSFFLKLIYHFIAPIEQKLINRCVLIQTSSPNYQTRSLPLQKNKKKVKVIPLGIDPEAIANIRTDIAWAKSLWHQDQFRIFHLGRMTHYKNQKLLIELASKNKHNHIIIGGNGALLTSLQQQIKNSNTADNVTLTGALSWPQVHALYQTCDVFCLPSDNRAESFGVVLLEAMWHNKIILVSDTTGSGMSWLAQNYNKGFVFKNNDIEDLIQKLHDITTDKQNIQSQPKDFKYHINDTANAVLKLYHSITQQENI